MLYSSLTKEVVEDAITLFVSDAILAPPARHTLSRLIDSIERSLRYVTAYI
jgi:hypothetical protein